MSRLLRHRDRPRHLVLRAALLIAAVLLPASPAGAQTRFAWPDTAVDLSRYTTVEECQVAVRRTGELEASRAELASGVWKDTMPVVRAESTTVTVDTVPPAVARTARECMARFSAEDSVPLGDYEVVLPLYLTAGWGAKARQLVVRRFAAIKPDDDTDRVKAIRTTIGSAFGPIRVELAEELLRTEVPRISSRVERVQLSLMAGSLVASRHLKDTATVRAFVRHVRAIVDSLTPKEREELEEHWGWGRVDADAFETQLLGVMYAAYGRHFLDSLRVSTKAYVATQRRHWAQLTGRRGETYRNGIPIGEQVPMIAGDIRLGVADPAAPRPTPGRPSMVVFLLDCVPLVANPYQLRLTCARHLAALRRLEQTFPELEITLVSRSKGHFSYLKDSITPEREARLLKHLLEAARVHAPLVMETTDAWRIPEPDNRRIAKETENQSAWSFGRTVRLGPHVGFLVDEDGVVVHSWQFHNHSFLEFEPLIRILLERQQDSTETVP